MTFNEKLEKITVDQECETMIKELKEEKLPHWLPSSNQHHFDVLWKFDEGINPDLHNDYLSKICETFHDGMKHLVSTYARTTKLEHQGTVGEISKF